MKSSDFIQEKAAAKINLALAVGNRREDGYHDIDTVMHSISLADYVEIRPSDRIDVTVEGAELPQGPDNLAYAAASLFLKKQGRAAGLPSGWRSIFPWQQGWAEDLPMPRLFSADSTA